MHNAQWLAGTLVAILLSGAASAIAQSDGGKKTQWDGIYTDAQAKRGADAYQASCASCHGADLLGGEMSPALAGPEFAANWSGQSLGDLFDRIRTSMPQDKPGALSSRAYADILAFMLSKGGAPTGQAELPSRADALQTVTFAAAKP
jgi:S-disulfanyl-L-cysteine oxidoreductase SoxD